MSAQFINRFPIRFSFRKSSSDLNRDQISFGSIIWPSFRQFDFLVRFCLVFFFGRLFMKFHFFSDIFLPLFGYGLTNDSQWLDKTSYRKYSTIFAWIKPKINIYDDCVLYGAFVSVSFVCDLWVIICVAFIICRFNIFVWIWLNSDITANHQHDSFPFIIHVQQRYRCKIECWPAKTAHSSCTQHAAHKWIVSRRWWQYTHSRPSAQAIMNSQNDEQNSYFCCIYKSTSDGSANQMK